jgi:hypothetical protein
MLRDSAVDSIYPRTELGQGLVGVGPIVDRVISLSAESVEADGIVSIGLGE